MNYKYTFFQTIRTYKKHYILATCITVILAVGMSFNATVFMIINTVLFRPMYANESHNLLSIYDYDITSNRFKPISHFDYLNISEYSSSFDSYMAFTPSFFKFKSRNTKAQMVMGEYVTDNYFDVLGIKPIVGRTFTDTNKNNENYSQVIISYNLWKNKFNSDPDIIGSDLEIDEKLYVIIGIMPQKFHSFVFPGVPSQVWIPFSNIRDKRENFSSVVVGRLKDNVTFAQAQVEITSRCQWLDKMHPASDVSRNFRLFRTNDIRIVADPSAISIARGIAFLLQTLVITILFVILLNIAALFIAWGTSRKNEIAIMMALGCTRGRIVCQFLIENTIISIVGGIFGLLIAKFLPQIILESLPALPMNIEIVFDAAVDIRVVLFMFFLCLISGILSGLMPAIRASRIEPGVLLTENDVEKTLFKIKRLHWIIVPQIVLSLFLLIPAGLLYNSFIKIKNVYDSPYVKNSAVVSINFTFNGYSQEKIDGFLSTLMRETSKPHGIKHICFANSFPLSGTRSSVIMVNNNDKKKWGFVSNMHVSDNCFETFDSLLLHGRIFDERDASPDSDAVIITKSLAEKFWQTSNPINQSIFIEENEKKWKTLKVIGIVNDLPINPLGNKTSEYTMFLPFSQNNSREISIIGSGGSQAPVILEKLQRIIYTLDDNIATTENSTMQQYGERQIYIITILITIFALLGFSGLLLTCICIYGLISHSIAKRRHEIGIRIAVGAQRKDIIIMFLKEGLKILVPALLIGNAGAALIVHILSNSSAIQFVSIFLPEVLFEPFVFIFSSAFIGSGTMLVCYIPTIMIIFKEPITLIKKT